MAANIKIYNQEKIWKACFVSVISHFIAMLKKFKK